MTDRRERPLVLVTGAAGRLGGAISRDLSRDHRVVGLDKAPVDDDWAGDEHLTCDLTEEAAVEEATDRLALRHGTRVASVIHLAAYYDFSGEENRLYRELTVEGTRRLLRSLRRLDVEQFVFSSSLLVMKPVEGGHVIRADSPTEALWAYPRSKLAAEDVIRREHGDVPAVILRIAGVYDDGCHSLPISQQIHRIREKDLESTLFPGNPSHGQPYIHLADVVTCVRKVVEHRGDLAPWTIFLVAESDLMSYGELQDAIGELVHGREWPALRVPAPLAKVGAWARDRLPGGGDDFIQPWMIDQADAHYPVDIARTREQLDWTPRHRLRTTLGPMIDRLKADPAGWYAEHGFGEDDRDDSDDPSGP